MNSSLTPDVIVGIISLVVSIIVFVTTILINYIERNANLNREQVLLFTQKVDEFIKEVDSQKLLDNEEQIYQKDEDNNYEPDIQYSNIQHIIHEMSYNYQMVLLYTPKNTQVVKSVVELISILKEKFYAVNKVFLNDLKNFHTARQAIKNTNSQERDDLLKKLFSDFKEKESSAFQDAVSYDVFYNDIVSILMEGLSYVQRQSTKTCAKSEEEIYLKKVRDFVQGLNCESVDYNLPQNN